MGYTHYWRQQRSLNSKEWKSLCDEARRVIKEAEFKGIPLAGGDGTGIPVVNNKRIVLNGDARSGDDHETFFVTQTQEPPRSYQSDPNEGTFSFCKTACKPYDAVVVTILAHMRDIDPPAFKVSSDGGDEAIKKEL